VYQLLEVNLDASMEEIKHSYHRLTVEFGEQTDERAKIIFDKITKAFKFLQNENLRADL